jgi:NAD(P)-dependent dehydrogenase (short-subunit alcohol dehydrogenase family)
MAKYIVIAASSSIGTSVVEKLKASGNEVFTTSRSAGYDAVLEASDFSAVEEVFKQAGVIDGVVCCAGSLLLKGAAHTSFEEYMSVIHASLTTSFAVTRAAGKYMKNGGSVVLISSAAAMEGLANHEAIAAAKGGVIALARSAAATYAGQNLRFNVIAPGLTKTNLTKALTSNEMSLKVSESMHALGRIGEPEDVASAIVFLLSPENSWITGQVLGVDGGLSRVRPKAKA